MISFDWPWALFFFPLPLLVFYLLPAARRDERALRVPFYTTLTQMTRSTEGRPAAKSMRFDLQSLIAILAWLALILASANPKWVGDPITLPSSGRDLMLAVDISGSMKREDLKLKGEAVTRLDVVKTVLTDFMLARTGDRIGLILFGSQAYLQAPLTFDRTTVATLLYESQIGFAGEQTAIGDALGLAVKRLRSRPENDRILILLTDGANTAGEITPEKALEIAVREGIKIYTIGVGASEMEVPGAFGGLFGSRTVNPSADLDEGLLQAIAEQSGGRYFRAHDTEELQDIYRLLDEIEPIEQDAETFNPTRSLFVWPLAAFFVLCSLLLALRIMRLKPKLLQFKRRGEQAHG